MVLGANSMNYTNREATKQDGVGKVKGYALDVSALGGIRANSIKMESTEDGMGVKVEGSMAATSGDLVFTTDGKLEFKKNANIKAKR